MSTIPYLDDPVVLKTATGYTVLGAHSHNVLTTTESAAEAIQLAPIPKHTPANWQHL